MHYVNNLYDWLFERIENDDMTKIMLSHDLNSSPINGYC